MINYFVNSKLKDKELHCIFLAKNYKYYISKLNTGLTIICVETQNWKGYKLLWTPSVKREHFKTRGTWMPAASGSHEFEKSLTNFIEISHSNILLWKWNYHCPWPPYTYQNFSGAKFIFCRESGLPLSKYSFKKF